MRAMKLQEWMTLSGVNGAEMGRRLGFRSPATVYRYIYGTRTPGPETLRKIADNTGGQVTANDFIHPGRGS